MFLVGDDNKDKRVDVKITGEDSKGHSETEDCLIESCYMFELFSIF